MGVSWTGFDSFPDELNFKSLFTLTRLTDRVGWEYYNVFQMHFKEACRMYMTFDNRYLSPVILSCYVCNMIGSNVFTNVT